MAIDAVTQAAAAAAGLTYYPAGYTVVINEFGETATPAGYVGEGFYSQPGRGYDPYGLYDEFGSAPSPWWQGAGYYAQTTPGGGDAFTSWGPGYEYLGAVGSETPLGGLLQGAAFDAPTVSSDPWSGERYTGNIRYTPNIDFRSLTMQDPSGSTMQPVGDAALQDYMTQTYGPALNALVGSTTERLSPDIFRTPTGITYRTGLQDGPMLGADPMAMAKLLMQVPGAAEDPRAQEYMNAAVQSYKDAISRSNTISRRGPNAE